MKTSLHIDKSLMNQAARLTGIDEKAALVRMALEALIRQEIARQAIESGSDPNAVAEPRRGYEPRKSK